jgi:hypothetical protein
LVPIADARITLSKTVQRIAQRSSGVAWEVASEGLALALTRHGYALTTMPRFYRDIMPGRVTILDDDGAPMAHGHVLTIKERERAIWAILRDSPGPENRLSSNGERST